MSETPYWRVHVRVDEDPLSTLTFTRASDGCEEAGEVSADAIRAYAELLGLPEDWTLHVGVSSSRAPRTGGSRPGRSRRPRRRLRLERAAGMSVASMRSARRLVSAAVCSSTSRSALSAQLVR